MTKMMMRNDSLICKETSLKNFLRPWILTKISAEPKNIGHIFSLTKYFKTQNLSIFIGFKFNSKTANKLSEFLYYLTPSVKVGKSKKYFFLKLHCPKTNNILDKILPYEAREESFSYTYVLCSFFGQWSFKKKCFWDLLTFSLHNLNCFCKYIMIYIIYIVRQLFKGGNYSREETINY